MIFLKSLFFFSIGIISFEFSSQNYFFLNITFSHISISIKGMMTFHILCEFFFCFNKNFFTQMVKHDLRLLDQNLFIYILISDWSPLLTYSCIHIYLYCHCFSRYPYSLEFIIKISIKLFSY